MLELGGNNNKEIRLGEITQRDLVNDVETNVLWIGWTSIDHSQNLSQLWSNPCNLLKLILWLGHFPSKLSHDILWCLYNLLWFCIAIVYWWEKIGYFRFMICVCKWLGSKSSHYRLRCCSFLYHSFHFIVLLFRKVFPQIVHCSSNNWFLTSSM